MCCVELSALCGWFFFVGYETGLILLVGVLRSRLCQLIYLSINQPSRIKPWLGERQAPLIFLSSSAGRFYQLFGSLKDATFFLRGRARARVLFVACPLETVFTLGCCVVLLSPPPWYRQHVRSFLM